MDLIDRLAKHKALAGAPREELAWLAAHGTMRQLNTGDVLTPKSTPVAGMYVVLSGHIAMFVDRGAGPQQDHGMAGRRRHGPAALFAAGQPAGRFGGAGATEILVVPREQLRALTRECHEVTSILVHNMLDRTRAFTSSDIARREDGFARQIVGGPGARAEQSRVGHRAQRRAARGAGWRIPSGRRACWARPG